MKKSGRYTTTGLAEDQYEEGADGLVLKNSLHIQDKQAIEEVEGAKKEDADSSSKCNFQC